MVPFVIKPPKLELKPLPEHLKYRYLGEQNTLPVIIFVGLDANQKEALLNVLKMHKKAIGWMVANIKGINPAFCQHKIRLEEGKKLVVDAQCRLNPSMKELVSPTQCVPNKRGLTVVENDKNEFIPTRIVTGKDYYCFIDGYSGYHQIPIHLNDQEKNILTGPFGTYAFKVMSFGLCNTPATSMICMTAIFTDMLEQGLDVFIDDFSV
ncbi:Retrotransposon gag protein [Gossypium australe]|uniref:Retrotransposon gag protein n=1 Tax=Gossypium australe TaxID=47621 RepID=A0A5B6UXJ2_9ROSI|nr:Retrotransposon gag protein [Gossypium australe]